MCVFTFWQCGTLMWRQGRCFISQAQIPTSVISTLYIIINVYIPGNASTQKVWETGPNIVKLIVLVFSFFFLFFLSLFFFFQQITPGKFLWLELTKCQSCFFLWEINLNLVLPESREGVKERWQKSKESFNICQMDCQLILWFSKPWVLWPVQLVIWVSCLDGIDRNTHYSCSYTTLLARSWIYAVNDCS